MWFRNPWPSLFRRKLQNLPFFSQLWDNHAKTFFFHAKLLKCHLIWVIFLSIRLHLLVLFKRTFPVQFHLLVSLNARERKTNHAFGFVFGTICHSIRWFTFIYFDYGRVLSWRQNLQFATLTSFTFLEHDRKKWFNFSYSFS